MNTNDIVSDTIKRHTPNMAKLVSEHKAVRDRFLAWQATLPPPVPPSRLEVIRARIRGAIAVLCGDARADYGDD